MVENGARNLVLAGRTLFSDTRASRQKAGHKRHRVAGRNAPYSRAGYRRSGPLEPNLPAGLLPGELRGVVHAAAVFDWSLLKDMTPEAFASVMRPKVAGTKVLHEWSKSQKLDFFVMFSSTTSLLGSRNPPTTRPPTSSRTPWHTTARPQACPC